MQRVNADFSSSRADILLRGTKKSFYIAHMQFAKWLANQPRGTLARLVRETGVSSVTLHKVARGERLSRYGKAAALSKATDGAVSIADLCGETPPKKRSQRRT